MFDVGGGELLLIVLAILLLFGPEKLPEVAQTIGKGMRKVKQAQAQFQSQLNDLQREITKEDVIPVADSKPELNTVSPVEPESSNKIGALDQLDMDSNFVTEYVKQDSDKLISEAETGLEPTTEKVSTSKNNSNQKNETD